MYHLKSAGMQLAESCMPPMQSGEYVLEASYESQELAEGAVEHQRMFVEGIRFTLDPSEVQSVYPPEHMTGSFGLTLPHIVFLGKTLPWERSVYRGGNDFFMNRGAPSGETPWIALLLLCEDEIVEVGAMPVKDLKPAGDCNIYFPDLEIREEEGEAVCSYIDLDAGLFLRIAPGPEELVFLSHARKADVTRKAERETRAGIYAERETGTWMSAEQEGWHSVVLGNRLPRSSAAGVRCRAYAVSLEGYGSYPKPGEVSVIRLVTLYSWDFISVTKERDMKERFAGLSKNLTALPSDGFDGEAKEILEQGFVPVSHVLRNGEQTVSFYRGPFSPVLPGREPGSSRPVMSADSLYRYDPENGMFDISYAAAWQMGRMLALSSRSIATAIMRQRFRNYRLAHRRLTQEMMGNASEKTMGQSLLEFMETSMAEFLLENGRRGEEER